MAAETWPPDRLARYVQRMMSRMQGVKVREMPQVVSSLLDGLARRAGAAEAHLFAVQSAADGYRTGSLRYTSVNRDVRRHQRFPLQLVSAQALDRLRDDQAVIVTTAGPNAGGPLIEDLLQQSGCGAYFLCPIRINGQLRGLLGMAGETRAVFRQDVCRLLRQASLLLYWQIRMIRREAKLRRRYRKWNAIAARACDLTITIDDRRKIVDVLAPRQGQLLRHLLGRSINELVDSVFHAELHRAIEHCRRDAAVRMIHFRLSTGETGSRWFAARIDPAPETVTLYLTDNHEDQLRQEEIRTLQTRLRETERLRLVGKMNTEFAHQLNQPMQSILTRCNMLQRQIADQRDTRENNLRVLKLVEDTIGHTKSITASIRQFVQEGRLDLVPVVVDDLLAQAFLLVSPLARDFGAQLNFPAGHSGVAVVADAVQTAHVLLNLLLNAMEACQEANIEQPRIEVRLEPRDRTHLAVIVSDNGPGLPVDRQRELFQEFSSSKAGGMGVGLTISRDICLAQFGELTAFNHSDGPGCSFCFTLPMAEASDEDTVEIAPIS